MAEVKKLAVPPALYDYVLYYECASKDWAKYSQKKKIKGDGSLLDAINWNSTYSFDPDDSGGKTLFGITESTWQNFVKKFPGKGYSSDLNSMGKRGFLDVVQWFWDSYSYAELCANYACGMALFQMSWGGFKNIKLLADTLKQNADKKDYKFIESGSNYKKVADATNAYSDPMVAYDIIRRAKSSYMYNISGPNNKNKKFRMGWLTRNVVCFTPYGLYINIDWMPKSEGLKYESTVADWEAAVIRWIQGNKSGYVRIMDWGASPESIAKMTNSTYNVSFGADSNSGSPQSGGTSGAYGGCSGVSQLGNYTNAPDAQIIPQQSQNREEVLNTLISGSYTPNEVKKCVELITSDKKKGVKTKSES